VKPKHLASKRFWQEYSKLNNRDKFLADKAFLLLKQNALHPSL
jgi:hypothetical protein